MSKDAENIVDIYRRRAKDFDTDRSRALFEKGWLDAFCALLPAGGSVLDVGCGMGEPLARYLLERGFAVTGVDSSPELIAMCRKRFPRGAWIVAERLTGFWLGTASFT